MRRNGPIGINFETFEDAIKCAWKSPKNGNDDDNADEQVVWVSSIVVKESMKYKTTYGGTKYAYQVLISSYMPHGQKVGKYSSGRKCGAPFSDEDPPTTGSDMNGPTAVIKSIGKINNAEFSLYQSLNMKLVQIVFENDDGIKRLADLIRVFIDQKADHIQINVVSAKTLKAAQKETEKYKDLVVKVAGYNARFVDLHKSRMEISYLLYIGKYFLDIIAVDGAENAHIAWCDYGGSGSGTDHDVFCK